MTKKNTRNYRIYPSLFEEMNEGYVWVNEPEWDSRKVARITNVSNGKTIYCETRTIDDGFKNNYREKNSGINDTRPLEMVLEEGDNQIVISQWYRDDLKIDTGKDVKLRIEKSCWPYGNYFAAIQHPNVVSRLASRIGIWGFILAILSISVGLLTFKTTKLFLGKWLPIAQLGDFYSFVFECAEWK